MYLPDIDYYAPESIPEACELLARLSSRAKVIAGGTDVLSKMKQEMLVTQAFVSLKNIRQLGNIESVEGRGVVIGAKATHNDLVDSPILQRKYPAICGTAHSMANLQVRNRGTIGGNIVNAVPSADLPPILIALGATVTLVGTAGERTLLLEDFFVGPGQTVIAPDEILIEIVIPNQSITGSSYFKFGLRHSGALAVVGVAAAVTFQNGVIGDARIVLGAVAPVPMRAREAEDILTGRMASEELLEEAGKRASRECRPISDIRGSEEYRRDMVKVFTKRALRKALYGNISEEDGGHHNADYDG